MATFITIGDNFIASTTAYIGLVFSDVFPLVAVVLGLIIGFFIVRQVIGILRGRTPPEEEDEEDEE